MWGDSKRDLIIAENAAAKREIELLREQVLDLKEERETLRLQLKITQDALVAKESPEAYRDMIDAREEAKKHDLSPEELKELELRKRNTEVISAYIQEQESPLFRDADDLRLMLSGIVGMPGINTKPVHDNDES